MFLYLKALHIIFIVTWFAALFYMPRLFVYHVEATEKPEPARAVLLEQLKMMESRLWFVIGWPSAILTLIMGTGLVFHPIAGDLSYASSMPSWLWVKIGFVGALLAYHHWLHFIYKAMRKDVYRYTSVQLRMINEVSTLLLIMIVLLVVVRRVELLPIWLAWIVGLAILFMVIIKLVRKAAQKKKVSKTS